LNGVLGEIAALLISASSGLPSSAASVAAAKCSRLAGSARSAEMCCVQLGSRPHSSGTSSRLQVMMRQPSRLKRLTVAWPIPRLAPVRITVLRSLMPPG
jgi:hypothetical protein